KSLCVWEHRSLSFVVCSAFPFHQGQLSTHSLLFCECDRHPSPQLHLCRLLIAHNFTAISHCCDLIDVVFCDHMHLPLPAHLLFRSIVLSSLTFICLVTYV
uniref:Uncharacterized protein n=1 Tax=Parascaris univalens TaxID=6257 RepID=A0A915AVI2_PARUN